MGHAFIPGLEAKAATTVVKVRELPTKGEILVQSGMQVAPADIVARANLPGDLHILRIPEKLGLEAREVLAGLQMCKIEVGSTVQREQLICEHAGLFGLFRSRFHSPVEGTVEYISATNGHVGVREAPRPITLEAYIGGKVVAVAPGKSVTIEARAAFVQGIFGVGGERRGNLRLLPVKNDQRLSTQHIPTDIQGCILVGGTAPSADVLKLAQSRGAVGLVTGAVDDQALQGFLGYDIGIALTGDEPIAMTLIVTEGFGTIAMAARVTDVLRPFDGQAASINGATQVRAGALRPEIIVSHGQALSSKHARLEGGLVLGAKVRLIRVPYFGLDAEVVELPHDPIQIETGAHARVLRARLTDGRVVTVPRANVELVG